MKRRSGTRIQEAGFTLVELMIVVVIIGILAALAIPRFMQATTKSKQSEAKQILKQIYTMERTFRQANGNYGDNGVSFGDVSGPGTFPEIGVEITATALYEYSIVAGINTFTATATADLDDDPIVDTWTITEAGALAVTPGLDDVTN